MASFLHIADVHLDSAFTAHFDTRRAQMRRSEVRRCLSGIIDKAKSVDVLLIAGDLFDGREVSADTIAFLKRKFSELNDTRVFIAAGNHDPYSENSVYAKENFGDNVHVFKTEAECIEIPQLKLRVHGVSFKQEWQENRIDIPTIGKKNGYSDILLMHADVTSIDGSSDYNPIDKRFIENCGADYLALGHIHKRSELKRAGMTYYAYPGVPEGRGFDECGDMGYYIGSINDGIADIKFERACIRRMFELEVDLSGVSDILGAADIIKKEMDKTGTADDMYKLVLTGRTPAGFPDIDILYEELLPQAAYLAIRNHTKIDYNIDELEAQNNLCGEFIRIMRGKQTELGTDISEEAIALGIKALLGGDM